VQNGTLPVVSSWQGSYGLLDKTDAVSKSVTQWHIQQTLQHAKKDANAPKQAVLPFIAIGLYWRSVQATASIKETNGKQLRTS
jgi:hypothetical protein